MTGPQVPTVALSRLDRAIATVAPRYALKRYEQRVRLEAASRFFGPGQYSGARIDRPATKNWTPRLGGPNSDSAPDLPALRARSADLVRNTPLATGAVHTIVTTSVGTGLRSNSRIDRELLGLSDETADAWERKADRIFDWWAESKACDIAGRFTFYQLQDLALRTTVERGDAFAIRRFVERPGDLLATKLQLIEGDRVSTPLGQLETEALFLGVEMDADGRHTRYWVRDADPGDYNFRQAWSWIPVDVYGKESGERRALQIARPTRLGQIRGVPLLAPVIEHLKQLDRFTEAELMAAVVSAFFTVFIKTPDEGAGLMPDMTPTNQTAKANLDPRQVNMGVGAVVGLEPGEEPVFANPMRPNTAFDPFVLSILRQVGVALELPFEFLVKHFTASYSASRAAILEAWRSVMTRRSWLVSDFCQPCREWVITEAVLRGYLVAPGFFDDPLVRAAYCRAEWTGPAMGQLNPVDEATAAEKRINLGVSTLAEETAQLTGGDWERKHAQRVKEHRVRVAAGLEPEVLGVKTTAAVAENAPAKLPAPDSGDPSQDEPPADQTVRHAA
ncbi:MAG TPA: phage portal protein [Candidatus Limnocylindria bacterium]